MKGALVICVLVVVFVVTSCIGGCATRDPWIESVDVQLNTGSFAWWEQVQRGK